MWKTAHWESPIERARCYLCPDCDSLGPHVLIADDRPGDAWLECIDCGAGLGRLTPQGIQAHAGPEPMESFAGEMPKPIDRETVLRALVDPVPEGGGDPGTAPKVNLVAVLMGWRQEV